MKITPVKGTNDYLPNEVEIRDYLQNEILKVYVENGFEHIYGMELEYFCVKILLCSSLKRIAQINNKKIRNPSEFRIFLFMQISIYTISETYFLVPEN